MRNVEFLYSGSMENTILRFFNISFKYILKLNLDLLTSDSEESFFPLSCISSVDLQIHGFC